MYQIAMETQRETFPNIRFENALYYLIMWLTVNSCQEKGKYELDLVFCGGGERTVIIVLLCLRLHNGHYF